MESTEQHPTKEEVLVKHYGYVPHQYLMDIALGAMQEYASLETAKATAQLRQENEKLKEQLKQAKDLSVDWYLADKKIAQLQKRIQVLEEATETQFDIWLFNNGWVLHSSGKYYHKRHTEWPPSEAMDRYEALQQFKRFLADRRGAEADTTQIRNDNSTNTNGNDQNTL